MKKHQNLFLRTLIFSLTIILISLFAYFGNFPLVTNFFHDIENKTYDLLFIARHNFNLDPKAPKNILIVGIDAPSIEKVGVPWPWPRQFHASLLDALVSASAKFVVYDIIFDTISPLSLQTQDIAEGKTIATSSFDAGIEDDNIFAQSISQAMNVFLACEAEPLSKTKYHAVLPIAGYIKAINNDTGFLSNATVLYDRDNFVRRTKIIFPEFHTDPAIAASTGFRVAQKYLNAMARINENYSVKLGNRTIPKEFLVNFYGPSETIRTISYWKALDLLSQGKDKIFKNKIIFIGRTKLRASIDPFKSVRSPDSFPTPFAELSPNFSGVELQATILGNILDDTYIATIDKIMLFLLMFSIGGVTFGIISKYRQRLVLSFAISMFLSLLYVYFSFLLFTKFNISIPPTFPTYGIILPIYFVNFLDQYFVVDRARRKQARIFRQLVPSQVADEIETMGEEQLALGGTKREITVLFSDIKNFTTLCEKNSPETIIYVLNEFFTRMVKIIHKHNGLVDKFIGDAIMVLWGSPKIITPKAQANLAVKCALAMKQDLKLLNKTLHDTEFKEELKIRIGLNTDEAITGNVGSLERIQFSAIGDGVNVASRLEAVNKVYGTGILMSDRTKKLLEDGYHLREIDTVFVPGKDIPIDIFELIDPDEFLPDLISNYSLALKHYREKNFEESTKYWQVCLNIKAEDSPSKVMLQRALKFKETGIPNDWKPIWNVETK